MQHLGIPFNDFKQVLLLALAHIYPVTRPVYEILVLQHEQASVLRVLQVLRYGLESPIEGALEVVATFDVRHVGADLILGDEKENRFLVPNVDLVQAKKSRQDGVRIFHEVDGVINEEVRLQ